MGLEPTRYCYHRHLKPARLPIPPLLHAVSIVSFFGSEVKKNLERIMSRLHKKKNRGMHFLIGLVLALFGLSLGGMLFLYKKNITLTFAKADYKLSNEALNNPYCGWYHTYSYQPSDEFVMFDQGAFDLALEADNNTRLCQVKFDLSAFSQNGISDGGLDQIDKILSYWSATDKQIILNFCYEEAPKDAATVYLHMEQLAPLINKYAANIFEVQGIFLEGAASESSLWSEENLIDFTKYLASLTDKKLFLTVQNPFQYGVVTEGSIMLTKELAYTGSLPSRLGIFDEGISTLASEADTKQLQQICDFVPSGGVIGADEKMQDLATAILVLQQRHISYLSADAPQPCIEQWKNETYRLDDVFSGITGYDYMTTHLGYRFCISDAKARFNTWKDKKVSIQITLNNQGFSNAYHPFDTSILLKNTETDELITLPVNQDSRFWNPGESVKITKKIDIKKLEKGSYKVYFLMMDSDTGESIRLGNDLKQTSNGYLLGTIKVE